MSRSLHITNLALKKTVTSKLVPDDSSSNQTLTRSKQQFMFDSQCLLCGQTAKKNKNWSIEVYPVRTVDFQNNILMKCDERRDEWSAKVRVRIESVNDLHAADAVSHQSCSVNLRTKTS